MTIDFEGANVVVEGAEAGPRTLPMATSEAFAAVAAAYLRCGWDNKYVYSFTWLGRPIIQLPDDAFRLQELVFAVDPDVIIETGIAHGGSTVFYASLCKLRGRGRVIAVEIDLRAHNRAALEAHPLREFYTIIEGSSTDPQIVEKVRHAIAPNEKVLVLLDSRHSKEHVLAELKAYAPLVTPDSYIVAMDGIMRHLVGAPRSAHDWGWNNPAAAAREFAAATSDFELVRPPLPFNEGTVTAPVTYCPDAFLKRIR